jgi:hypothetical protein
MRQPRNLLLVGVILAGVATIRAGASVSVDHLRSLPALPIGLWNKLNPPQDILLQHHDSGAQIPFVSGSYSYPAHYHEVPVDHFPDNPRYEPHSNATFSLRYWVDSRFYKEGGPVIVLDGGETSAVGRLPFLAHGIVKILAEATGGLG